jgi:hypothetical protein
LNGPYQVGKGDLDKFQNTGLKAKIPAGKKGVADRGYIGETEKIIISNSHDSDEIRKFKGHARTSHEGFNVIGINFLNVLMKDSAMVHRNSFV